MKYKGHRKNINPGQNMVCYIPLVDILYCTDARTCMAPPAKASDLVVDPGFECPRALGMRLVTGSKKNMFYTIIKLCKNSY